MVGAKFSINGCGGWEANTQNISTVLSARFIQLYLRV